MLLLAGCNTTIEIPDVDSLWVSPIISSYSGSIIEDDEKMVMSMFYGKYDVVSKEKVDMTEESNMWNILQISYYIEDKLTSISLWSSGYGTITIDNTTTYVKFHDGVHKQLLEYINTPKK